MTIFNIYRGCLGRVKSSNKNSNKKPPTDKGIMSQLDPNTQSMNTRLQREKIIKTILIALHFVLTFEIDCLLSLLKLRCEFVLTNVNENCKARVKVPQTLIDYLLVSTFEIDWLLNVLKLRCEYMSLQMQMIIAKQGLKYPKH